MYNASMTAEKIYIVDSRADNVFVNQAVEAALTDYVGKGSVALMLWANPDTVVIGRNQDAYAECRVDLLESNGGTLARRLSGGGAVFHDECYFTVPRIICFLHKCNSFVFQLELCFIVQIQIGINRIISGFIHIFIQ